MFIVKYYSGDKFLGEESFQNLETAEVDLYKSPFSFVGDFYEIIDQTTSQVVQEFIIPTYDLPLFVGPGAIYESKVEAIEWFD